MIKERGKLKDGKNSFENGLREVWETDDGVIVVELGHDFSKPVRAFLLPETDGYVLVDTGYAETAEQLLLAIKPYRITKIVLTHLHIDHAGGVALLKTKMKTPLFYHRNESIALRYAQRADEWFPIVFNEEDVPALRDALKFLRNFPTPDGFLDENVLKSWVVIETPGHTPGHVVFSNGREAVIGDLILSDDTSNVAYVPIPGYRPLSSYLSSVVKVAKLHVNRFLPSHGLLFETCRNRVKEIFAHHYERLSQTAAALNEGLKTPTDVATRIKWSKGSYYSLPPVEKWLALLETLSHLDFLAETGYAVNESTFVYKVSENPDWKRVMQFMEKLASNFWSSS